MPNTQTESGSVVEVVTTSTEAENLEKLFAFFSALDLSPQQMSTLLQLGILTLIQNSVQPKHQRSVAEGIGRGLASNFPDNAQ